MDTIEEIATNQATDGVHCSKGHQNYDNALPMLRLRCFVRRVSPSCHVAECIDLDISAEAETREKAIAALEDAVCGYLHVVFDGQDTNAPVPVSVLRPSPLSHRIRYYIEYLKWWLSTLLFPPRARAADRFFLFPPLACVSQCGI